MPLILKPPEANRRSADTLQIHQMKIVLNKKQAHGASVVKWLFCMGQRAWLKFATACAEPAAFVAGPLGKLLGQSSSCCQA